MKYPETGLVYIDGENALEVAQKIADQHGIYPYVHIHFGTGAEREALVNGEELLEKARQEGGLHIYITNEGQEILDEFGATAFRDIPDVLIHAYDEVKCVKWCGGNPNDFQYEAAD